MYMYYIYMDMVFRASDNIIMSFFFLQYSTVFRRAATLTSFYLDHNQKLSLRSFKASTSAIGFIHCCCDGAPEKYLIVSDLGTGRGVPNVKKKEVAYFDMYLWILIKYSVRGFGNELCVLISIHLSSSCEIKPQYLCYIVVSVIRIPLCVK